MPVRTFHVIILSDRAMLLSTTADGCIVFADSHSHINGGALITLAQTLCASTFIQWFDDMMKSEEIGIHLLNYITYLEFITCNNRLALHIYLSFLQ